MRWFSFLFFWAGKLSANKLNTHWSDPPHRIIRAQSVELISGKPLLQRLQKGGLTIYFRHFQKKMVGEANDTRKYDHSLLTLDDFADCSWQMPLSKYGTKLGKKVGASLEKLGVKVNQVISSPYCRCVDSAVALFGEQPERDIRLVYRKRELTRERMETYVQQLLLDFTPEEGTNRVIVGHRTTMKIFGLFKEGDALVFEPNGEEGYNLIGKIAAQEWISALSDPWVLGIDRRWHRLQAREKWKRNRRSFSKKYLEIF